ncbi:HtaA domain-containing protein [Galactobacter sp.]|uniref:HtaA domain-containing protein n=1 Tax=Galactobacter sp. TaxID=2676125 RepID=UPI0025C5C1E1|nr:HtaA domain-containing protein [Galactobacter sp.]
MSSTQPPRWRRGLATLTAAAVALLGSVAGVAAPAHAADTTKSVAVTATGFVHDNLPNPIKGDGTAGVPNGVYVAAFDKDADLSQVTMENMDETVAGNAAWVTKAKVGDGNFTTTLGDVPTGEDYQVVSWVAHGNITEETILSVNLLPAADTSIAIANGDSLEEEPEPAADPSAQLSVTTASAAEGLTVHVTGTDFFDLPSPSIGGNALGVYSAIVEHDLEIPAEGLGADATLANAWANPFNGGFTDGAFTADLNVPTDKLSKDKSYDVITWSAHGNITPDTLVTRDEITLTGAQKEALFPTPEPEFAPETSHAVTAASEADGLSVTVTGTGYENFPVLANGKDAQGVYVAVIDRNLATSDTDIEAGQLLGAEFAYKATIAGGNLNKTSMVKADALNKDKNYDVVVFLAHGNLNNGSQIYRAPIELTADQKEALFPTPKPEFKGTATYEPSTYAAGQEFSVEVAGKGFLKDTLPDPLNESGAPANGVYVAAFKPGTDLSKVTMDNMGDYTLGNADWVTGAQIDDEGNWSRTLNGIGNEYAGQKIQIVTWVAHGNIRDDVILTNDEVELPSKATEPTPDPEPTPEPEVKNYKVSDAVLTWGVKESFRTYMSHLPVHNDGKTTLSGGATQPTKHGVLKFPKGTGVIDENGKGTIAFKGGVRFTGHDGEMDLKMSNLKVKFQSGTKAQLILDADVPASETMNTPAFNQKGIVFANLTFPAKNYTIAGVPLAGKAAAAKKALVLNEAKAVLTEDGNKAMGGFYEAGEVMDPVNINATVSATSEKPAGTDNNGGSRDGNGDDNNSNGDTNAGKRPSNNNGSGNGNTDGGKDTAAKQCEPVVSTKDGRTVTATAFKDGSSYKVELKGSGFVNDKLPKPINDSGKGADGVYAAVVKQDADLSKITMDNMDDTTLGEAIWITKNSLGAKGEFTNSVRGIPADAGDKVRVITWVAHGNIGEDVITSDQVVKLDCATAGGSDNTGAPNNGDGANNGDNGSTPGSNTPGSTTPGSVTPGQAAAAQQCRVVFVSDGSAKASSSDSATSAASAPQANAPAADSDSGSSSAASGSATLNWGIKASFLSYIQGGIAKGNISTAGGAAQSGSGLTWGTGSGSLANGGTVTFPGSVHFTGHNGILDTTFSNLRIKSAGSGKATLILDSKSQDMDGKDASQSNVTFANITFSGDGSNGITNGKVSLTADGAKAFAGFYSAGQSLDSLNLTVSGSSAGAAGGATNPAGLFSAVQQLTTVTAATKDDAKPSASITPKESGITVPASANASDYQAGAPEGMKATIVCGDKMASTGADNANLIGAGAILALLGAAGVAFAARRKTTAKN